MFDCEWLKKKVPPPPPEIKTDTVYILKGEKADPWGIKQVARAKVVDVKSGWVRYRYVKSDGKSYDVCFTDEVKTIEDFDAIFEVDEVANGNL